MAEQKSYATADDIELRWETLTDAQRKQAEALILDASTAIHGQYPDCETHSTEQALRMVVCTLVITRMQSLSHMGATQASETTGPFTESYSYGSSGAGDWYLTAAMRRALGYGSGRAFTVGMVGETGERPGSP